LLLDNLLGALDQALVLDLVDACVAIQRLALMGMGGKIVVRGLWV